MIKQWLERRRQRAAWKKAAVILKLRHEFWESEAHRHAVIKDSSKFGGLGGFWIAVEASKGPLDVQSKVNSKLKALTIRPHETRTLDTDDQEKVYAYKRWWQFCGHDEAEGSCSRHYGNTLSERQRYELRLLLLRQTVQLHIDGLEHMSKSLGEIISG